VANTPVRVNLVNPGPTRTAMRAKAFPGEDPASLKPPDHVVETCIKLALPGCASVDGGHTDAQRAHDLVNASTITLATFGESDAHPDVRQQLRGTILFGGAQAQRRPAEAPRLRVRGNELSSVVRELSQGFVEPYPRGRVAARAHRRPKKLRKGSRGHQ